MNSITGNFLPKKICPEIRNLAANQASIWSDTLLFQNSNKPKDQKDEEISCGGICPGNACRWQRVHEG